VRDLLLAATFHPDCPAAWATPSQKRSQGRCPALSTVLLSHGCSVLLFGSSTMPPARALLSLHPLQRATRCALPTGPWTLHTQRQWWLLPSWHGEPSC
jgi:hypothetical protein